MNHKRAGQAGSTISFLLVGGALVILLAGGLYVLNNRGNDSGVKPSPSVAVKPKPTPALKPSKAPTKHSTKSPSTSKHDNATPVPLPATGPSEDLSIAGAFGLLVGASVAYAQSRKARLDLLHR